MTQETSETEKDGELDVYTNPQEYPVEYTGYFVAPVFSVTVDHEVVDSEGSAELMGEENFRDHVFNHSQEILSGEVDVCAQVVVARPASMDEMWDEKDEIENGLSYKVAIYTADKYQHCGSGKWRMSEGLPDHTIEKYIEGVEEMFKETAYKVTGYTLIPHKAGEMPLDPKKQYL